MRLKKFKVKEKVKPVFERSSNNRILKSTFNRIVCYRCGCGGGTLVKHTIGYAHIDPRFCVKKIEARDLLKRFLEYKAKKEKRESYIDYKIVRWFRRIWKKIWNFLKGLNKRTK